MRLLALERPGFGLSTPEPNRRILDWPIDVQSFAKGMQLDQIAVMGLSGGGPYAPAEY
jgi:pimeloyl-ACP methyl ester carboxylesterase